MSVPRHEILPACRFPEDVKSSLARYLPRILQFSGHGDAVVDGPLAGALAFETSSGEINLVPPDQLVAVLAKEHAPRLRCVFLNGCKTDVLAQKIVAARPRLTVICWGR